MWQPITDITERSTDSDACADAAWGIVAAAAQLSEELARGRRALSFAASGDATLREVAPSDPDALLCWVPDAGWQMAPSSDAARHAVIVGPGTVAADDPRLTTRLVPGPNPLRVILDPGRRLSTSHRVFSDAEADSIYVCAQSLVRPGERTFGRAVVVGVADVAAGGI